MRLFVRLEYEQKYSASFVCVFFPSLIMNVYPAENNLSLKILGMDQNSIVIFLSYWLRLR